MSEEGVIRFVTVVLYIFRAPGGHLGRVAAGLLARFSGRPKALLRHSRLFQCKGNKFY